MAALEELPPKSAKIALVLTAILFIVTMVWVMFFLNKINAQPTSQPSTQAPADNAKQP
jgi:flagellar basal body-associated protein FliL